jgi:hypothetical protein
VRGTVVGITPFSDKDLTGWIHCDSPWLLMLRVAQLIFPTVYGPLPYQDDPSLIAWVAITPVLGCLLKGADF